MAGESDAIMAAYKECLNNVSNKLGEEKSRSANTVAERLAARKRLREQRLTRTVEDEVLDQVGLGKVRVVCLGLFIIVTISSISVYRFVIIPYRHLI